MPKQRQAKKKEAPTVKLPSKRKQPVSAAGETVQDDSDSDSDFEDVGKFKGKKPLKASDPEPLAKDKQISNIPEINLLKGLDLLQFGPQRKKSVYTKMIGNHLVKKSIRQLCGADFAGRFIRRITSLVWHPDYPYVLASASKFGDIMLVSGVNSSENDLRFETKAEIQGGGAGYSITAMKFHPNDIGILYRTSIDCTVAKVDLIRGDTFKYYDTGDYNLWFCGMDVNFSSNVILAGDNKGMTYKFSLDGKLLSKMKLHKNKIHSIEFSNKDPNIVVTASLEKSEAVRIWDIRFMKESSKHADFTPLKSLPHSCGLNCAKFNPVDGSRLLTSDQKDEIRIYNGPLWNDYLLIKHHHKQFQHITPVTADWHPLNDYVVIGRYPQKTNSDSEQLMRAIDFFDSYSGELVDRIYPPLDEICSLNVFNPTGEYLATGMNSKLILWKPGAVLGDVENSKKPAGGSSKNLSTAMRNALRGRAARELTPADSGDDDDDGQTTNKKKRSRANTAAAAKKSSANRKKK